MTDEEWLAHLREVEAEQRRKDEAGAKAAQELADKKLRHLNKKVRDDPTWPNNCTHRIMDGEVPLPQLDEIIHVPDHPELKICDDVTGALSNFAIATATEWNKKFGKKSASKPVTLQTSKGDLTFKKKNKNVDGGQKTVAGYCCSVEGKEYWIHDSNKPTLYPPTYLAFEQHQYDADPLQRWKKSPRAECNCIMCTDVKNLDENTDHVLSLQIDTDPHSYVNNPAGNEVRGPGERGAGKRRKTLRPLNGGNPCVLHYCNSYLGPSRGTHSFYGCVLGGEIGYDGHQWKMQWEREADDTPQNP